MEIVYAVIGLAVGLIGGAIAGFFYRKKSAEKVIGSAEQEAARLVEEGRKEGENVKNQMLLEAKDVILKDKNDAERELKERRAEVSRVERRIAQREEVLDKKIENYERKEETLNRKIKDQDAKLEEVEKIKLSHIKKLEEIAGLTKEEAKAELINEIENEAKRDAVSRLVEIENQIKDEADKKAKDIISLAIQRLAQEHVSEATVSVVQLPNDDMKGRIIGREGRNIRVIEQTTGVDLIIDDTPETITVSCFDPVRREIARLALEKLIQDGRIHPTKIEETVEKARREVEANIKQAGEKALFDVGIHGMNNDLVRLLGRLRYRTSYGQNVLDHSVEVAFISGIIADELGVDRATAKRAGLLHDIGKAMTQEVEGSHVQIGIDIARKYKENKEIIHAIEAHHCDVEAKTIVAVIVQAADAISAARPGARREDIENYIKRLQKLEEIANSFDGVEKSYAVQAGREIRVMVKPEEVNDEQMAVTAREIAKKIEGNLEYPGQIIVNIIRESRATEYAK